MMDVGWVMRFAACCAVISAWVVRSITYALPPRFAAGRNTPPAPRAAPSPFAGRVGWGGGR
jgi:hypothetical protein